MVDQWGRFQKRLALEHKNSLGFPDATFYNFSTGTYDPDEGAITGGSRGELTVAKVEYIPPNIDTSVDTDGTSLSWDASIRFPDTQGTLTVGDGETYTVPAGETETYEDVVVEAGGTLDIAGTVVAESVDVNGTVIGDGTLRALGNSFAEELTPLGEDSEKPTEIELADPAESNPTVYQLHGYSYEQASGMLMCRLVEL